MNVTFRNYLATHGASLVTHIGLVNTLGIEISGGYPAYARKTVTWTTAVNGLVRPTVDLTFDIPAGATVAGWRGYSASIAGVDFGGAVLPAGEQRTFAGQGLFRLLASGTSITVS